MDRRTGSLTVPVVHVITKLELGGAQQNTLHTVARLDRSRFAPQLVCGPGGLLDDVARELDDVPVHFVPDLVRPIRPLKDRSATRAVRDLLAPMAAAGPVIVHTHSSKAGVIGRRAARAAGARPVIHTVHGFGHDAIRNPLLRRVAMGVERSLARHTDAFISVARCHVDEGRAAGLFGDKPVEVIRSGIDLEHFADADRRRADTRAALGLPADSPVVGMIVCLKPQKAPLDLAEIAADVLRTRQDAWFFLAGDGELREALQTRLAQLGLVRRVKLLGWRHDIPDLLGALDVLLLTSRWEGLPRVCPQAMAAGRPIVATAVDGIPEAVVDGRNGLLYPPGDARAGAAAVLSLLDDPERARAMGAAGREAAAEFGQDEMVARQEQLYEQLLGGPQNAL